MKALAHIFSIDPFTIPEGTEIKIIDRSSNDVLVEVSHADELTLLRLLQQVWMVEYKEIL